MQINEIDIQLLTSDHALLSSILLSLINLKECLILSINVRRIISETSTDRVQPRQSYASYERHQKITSDKLATHFRIGPSRANATLRATAQRGVRSSIPPS